MTESFIPYGHQLIGEDDIQAVVEVLRSPYLTTGPKVEAFEKAVCEYVRSPYGVAVSSGTAALHAAMAAARFAPGDEILIPTMSFLATANAALYVGAKPVFVDSEKHGFNLDLTDAEKKITSRTKGIVPVHFSGQPVNIEAVQALAKRHSLTVIEDAAHALGAVSNGRPIGGLSDMTIFSFHPVKHITTGEGGMVMTSNEALAKRLRQFRHHGIDVDVIQRDTQQRWRYDMTGLGYNYRLTDIQCALGISQLRKSEEFLKRREAIAAAYDKAFTHAPFLERPPRGRTSDRHAWHLYIVRLKAETSGLSRDEAFEHLRSQGIGVHVHYRPIHLHPYYAALGWRPGDCPQAEATFSAALTLPIHPSMTDAMVQRVITAVERLPDALIVKNPVS